MARLSRPVILAGVFLFLVGILLYTTQQQYRLEQVSTFLDTLDKNTFTSSSKTHAQKFDNNDPEVIQKHKIENQVNELLKKKLDTELKLEREALENRRDKMNLEFEEMKAAKEKLEKEVEEFRSETGKAIIVEIKEFVSEEPAYKKKVYTYKTNPKKDFDLHIDSEKNQVVILSSMTQKFSEDPDSLFNKFLEAVNSIEYPHYKTSLSFLIADAEEYVKIDEYLTSVFRTIEKSKDSKDLKDSFSKITIINAPFIESQFKVSDASKHAPEVQRERRRLLSQIRNFLITNSVGQERYTLSLDSDVIKLPKDLLSIFIDSGKDIATIRIVQMNGENVIQDDYDKNSWIGDRKIPTDEEDMLLSTDPTFLFEPYPGANSYNLGDVVKQHERFHIDPEDKKAAVEIDSIGGAVLFVKNEVFQQGVMFPPFYLIGTKWGRTEGFDGIETEGLCYMAKTIGYKCWGYPNLLGVHI